MRNIEVEIPPNSFLDSLCDLCEKTNVIPIFAIKRTRPDQLVIHLYVQKLHPAGDGFQEKVWGAPFSDRNDIGKGFTKFVACMGGSDLLEVFGRVVDKTVYDLNRSYPENMLGMEFTEKEVRQLFVDFIKKEQD